MLWVDLLLIVEESVRAHILKVFKGHDFFGAFQPVFVLLELLEPWSRFLSKFTPPLFLIDLCIEHVQQFVDFVPDFHQVIYLSPCGDLRR